MRRFDIVNSKCYFKFEDLQIYQKALLFGELENQQIKGFPKEEVFRLASQFIRAADSIAMNIAEGSSSTDANFNRYLQMAWDSAHECVVCSTKAFFRGITSEETNEQNLEHLTELSIMTTFYRNYLKKKINKIN